MVVSRVKDQEGRVEGKEGGVGIKENRRDASMVKELYLACDDGYTNL